MNEPAFEKGYKLHKIKILEDFADGVLDGSKTFEVRKNDRDYQRGDHVVFEVVSKDPDKDCGQHKLNSKEYEITYVLNGWGIESGYVVFAIKEVKEHRSGFGESEHMTNSELLRSLFGSQLPLTDKKLAELMCKQSNDNCEDCPGLEACTRHHCGLEDWLKQPYTHNLQLTAES